MTEQAAVALLRETIFTALLAASPMLIAAIVVGVVVSIFQSITQIKEMTLTFVPKIVAVFAVAMLFFPWIAQLVSGFTLRLIAQIPNYIR
ncbi:MAG: flagellar biosynthetic protein FliQ [Candidatus Omnitrophota bacterium]|nr:MAG: flagellar biosynthetic protein FliQ [Candidatus Omnitrophota bacterium]